MQIVVNPGVITVVLYISEIISMATVDNFDVEELFVKQNSYPKSDQCHENKLKMIMLTYLSFKYCRCLSI